ncbi:MAG: T9SS type A sorting domain-containing protein [Bacteroidetes bacterium]|nr:T9SS type A sorting domain-containing protein [Bacteroidota bacterium]
MKKTLLSLIGAMFMATGVFAQCNELFFSEYIEGSGNNKAIEIYNPSSSAIDLSAYKVLMITNGGSSTAELQMSGMIQPYDVYVIANNAANARILAVKDTMFGFPSVVTFNGDDAVALLKGTDTIDCIGERWKDPGTEWTVGSGSTKDHSLVRMSSVKGGTKDWNTAQNQWDVYPIDTMMYLGSHTSDCYVPVKPVISFAKASVSVKESAGTYDIEVMIQSPSSSIASSATISATGGTAVKGTDYNASIPGTVSFAAGSSTNEKVTLTLIDNSTAQGSRTLILTLSAPSAGVDLGADSSMIITITDDDYRVSTIADAIVKDADLYTSNKGENVEVTGIVYGPDYDPNAGISFSLVDATGAVNIFNFVDVGTYQSMEGDSITVRGHADFYNGLAEIFADSIKKHSSGNALKSPKVVQKPSEETESALIKVEKIWIVDTTTVWAYKNVMVANEKGDTFIVRIDDALVDVIGTKVLYDTMNITGIGNQYDNIAPYNSGYQIFPRGLSDIEKWEDKGGVENTTFTSVIYPNPTSGMVTINSKMAIGSINVTNVAGQTVRSFDGNKSLNQSVSLEGLKGGIYIIQISSGEMQSFSRIVVQ